MFIVKFSGLSNASMRIFPHTYIAVYKDFRDFYVFYDF